MAKSTSCDLFPPKNKVADSQTDSSQMANLGHSKIGQQIAQAGFFQGMSPLDSPPPKKLPLRVAGGNSRIYFRKYFFGLIKKKKKKRGRDHSLAMGNTGPPVCKYEKNCGIFYASGRNTLAFMNLRKPDVFLPPHLDPSIPKIPSLKKNFPLPSFLPPLRHSLDVSVHLPWTN